MSIFSMKKINAQTPIGLVLVGMLLVLGGCAATPKTAPQPAAPVPGAHEQAEAAYRAQDYQTVRRILEPLAEQGDATAQYIVGYMYYYGQGVASNPALARVWIERAAEQGHNKARVALAQLDQAREGQSAPQAAPQPSSQQPVQQALQQPQPLAPLPATQAATATQEMEDPEARPAIPATAGEAQTAKSARSEPAPWEKPAPAMPATPEARDDGVRGNAWVMAQPPGRYTIQLLAARDEQAVLGFIERYKLGSEAAYYTFTRSGVRWYAVVYGSYESNAAARAALDGLDPALRTQSPWVRNFGGIQHVAR